MRSNATHQEKKKSSRGKKALPVIIIGIRETTSRFNLLYQ